MSPALNERGEVRAAGGIVWRQRPGDDGEIEILVVHRPKYDDWSLPKGKADAGESDDACAHREVEEETGYQCVLGREAATVRYRDRFGRPKAVRYWLMRVESGSFAPHDEVDEIRWVTLDEAASLLDYGHDVALLDDITFE